MSPGHELHDRTLKRSWYASFGIPNYWIIDAFQQTIECLALQNGAYERELIGAADAAIAPRLFPGLAINLKEVWEG